MTSCKLVGLNNYQCFERTIPSSDL